MTRFKLRQLISWAAVLATSTAAQADVVDGRPPATVSKPSAVTDLRSAMTQTAVVLEGRVSDVRYEYNRRDGPWTSVILSDVRAHFGSAPEQVEIRQFGGPLPDGRTLVVAELPEFTAGERYVVFLRNTAWNLSPVVGELAFRVESLSGGEALVTAEGLAVTGVSPRGVQLAPTGLARLQPGSQPQDSLVPESTEPVASSTPPRPVGRGSEGVAAQAVDAGALARQRDPLDVESFMAALAATSESRGMSASGVFYEQPAREFNWYRQLTAAPAGAVPADGLAKGSTRPEIDTTEPTE